MRNFLLIFLLFCACYKANSQVNYFNRVYDLNLNINAYQDLIIINPDSSIVFGFSRDLNHKRFITYAFIDNATGDTLYTFKHGRDTIDIYGGMNDYNCIINNVIYSCGGYYKNGNAYANFMKFSLDGDLILDSLYYIPISTQYAWTQFNSMLPLNDGSFLLVGNKESSYGNLDAWLVKMDSNGNILWEKSFNSSWNDQAISIVPHQGNYLISGGKIVSGKFDVWLICVDSDGILIWEKTYGGPFYDGGNAMSLNNGEIHLSGGREYAENYYESFVMRLNNNGDFLWQKSLFSMQTFNLQSSLGINMELSDGSILSVGGFYEYDSPMDSPVGIIYKMSQNGDSIWTRILKLRTNDHYTWDLEELDNGDFLMSGYVFPDSPNNTQDGWLMRTNCLGYFEHPKDSVVFSGDGGLLYAQNLSSYFEYTTIAWGDNEIDTLYEGNVQSINHTYSLPGNYIISTSTVACNDTIKKTIEYTANPPNLINQHVLVFPNPNDGNFQVWLNSEDLWQLEVFDASGRMVFGKSDVVLKTGFTLNLSACESAVYFVRVRSELATFMERVVVSK